MAPPTSISGKDTPSINPKFEDVQNMNKTIPPRPNVPKDDTNISKAPQSYVHPPDKIYEDFLKKYPFIQQLKDELGLE